MPPKSRTASPAAKTATAAKPAAKRASGVRRRITADGGAEVVKPATKRAAKPKATAAKAAPKTERKTDAAKMADIQKVGKLRAAGTKWTEIEEQTGFSQSALARMRLVGKREGVAGFTR